MLLVQQFSYNYINSVLLLCDCFTCCLFVTARKHMKNTSRLLQFLSKINTLRSILYLNPFFQFSHQLLTDCCCYLCFTVNSRECNRTADCNTCDGCCLLCFKVTRLKERTRLRVKQEEAPKGWNYCCKKRLKS